jgi:hypothetical protein
MISIQKTVFHILTFMVSLFIIGIIVFNIVLPDNSPENYSPIIIRLCER